MKVKVTYTEVQYFEMTTEIEMTAKEYKEYLKSGNTANYNSELNLKHDFTGQCGDEFHTHTQIEDIVIEKI